MALAINTHKLQALIEEPFVVPSPHELRREGTVFFIGGSLPVFETLETMYESHCQESSGLFHVTFSGRDELQSNLELVRQIKKNFSVRMMGRINYDLPDRLFEQLYLAGLDLLDIPWHVLAGTTRTSGHDRLPALVKAAAAFPRWSLTSSILSDEMEVQAVRIAIDNLLDKGLVPLLSMPARAGAVGRDDATGLFGYLADAWQRYDVPVKPLLPLIRLSTPLEPCESGGFLRSAIDRFHDRRMMVSSDLRRHLRTSGAEASFESSGL